MNPRTLSMENQHILYDADVLGEFDVRIFEADTLQQLGLLTGTAAGRGTTWFFSYRNLKLVLRHYRRGGWVARWLKDRYLWMGLRRTRAWREFHLLAHLHQTGLPAPRPAAARILRASGGYTADLITHRILYAAPLAEALKKQGLDVHRWRTIGFTLRRFHDAGVYHADLNAHNILLGKNNSVFLIDFDKGELRAPRARWQQKNLQRLQRSLGKLQNAFPGFHFHETDWRLLMDAYQKKASV